MAKCYEGLDGVFRALADETRRAIVERLVRGPASVSDLAAPFEMAMPTVMQHLKILEEGGLVTSSKAGRVRTYQYQPGSMADATAWMSQQRTSAEQQLDRLGDFLSTADSPSKKETSDD